MPHIIVEYSKDLADAIDVQTLVNGLHETLGKALGDTGRIKSRAYAAGHFAEGEKGADGAFIHITLLLLEDRDLQTKKQYAQPLHDLAQLMARTAIPDCAVTLEVRDMDKDSYFL